MNIWVAVTTPVVLIGIGLFWDEIYFLVKVWLWSRQSEEECKK